MSLLEEINAKRGKQPCLFGRWAATTTQQDRDDLATAFTDHPKVSGQLIADVLASRIDGWIVDYIRKHRRGACKSCPQTALYLNVAS